MSQIDLGKTKQSKQISILKNLLEKIGFKIIEEIEGGLQDEDEKDNPELMYSWLIQRNLSIAPFIIDFIAGTDHFGYNVLMNECSECEVRGAELSLRFKKDRALKNPIIKAEWHKSLNDFIQELSNLS